MTNDKEMMALIAIRDGKTLGQFLRDLPNSSKMTKDELNEYAQAYKRMRAGL